MRFFDTHAHLNDESFDTDRAALIEGLPSCGAELIMDVACAAEDFDKINKLQMSRDEKILRSDFIIDTGVDINKLRKSVVNLLGELK